jgi:holin-like protein
MTAALAGILLCQLAGEFLCRFFALPMPGPVVGMGLLFIFLLARGGRGQNAVPKALGGVADQLLGHLSLLFVPATVGLMRYFDVLGANALMLVVSILVSTAVAMAVTAVTFRLLTRDKT